MSAQDISGLQNTGNFEHFGARGEHFVQPAWREHDEPPSWAEKTCSMENEHTSMQHHRCFECGRKANHNIAPAANCVEGHLVYKEKFLFEHCPHCGRSLE